MKRIVLSQLLLFLLFSAGFAQSISDCLICHEDNSLSFEKNGREISLYVDQAEYEASPHSQLDCVSCHVGFDPEEIPHKESIEPVDCSTCHDETVSVFQRSGHSDGLNCASCHGNPHAGKSDQMLVQECRICHEDEGAELSASAHGANGAGPSCIGCHSSHALETDSETCLSCHGQKEFVHKNITHEDLESVMAYSESIHGDLISCSDCHSGHLILPADSENSTVSRMNIAGTCGTCHEDIAEAYLRSEHGASLSEGFIDAPTCTDCHGEHDIHQITDSRSRVSREHEIETCQKCHLDSPEVRDRMTHSSSFIASYDNSIHGRAFAAGNLEAAICRDCHGGHEELKATNPESKVNKFNITETCGQCHESISSQFSESIHGTALTRGVAEAPTCTDCHGEHNIIEPERRESPVAPQNVSQQVCGPCHSSLKLSDKYGFRPERFSTFTDSYHGLAVRFGSVEAANCASCHGIHDILPMSDPRSRVHPDNLANTCGQCHPGANRRFAVGKVHIIRTSEEDKLIYWVSTIYIFLIVATIGSMVVHNSVDWIRKIIAKYKERFVEPKVLTHVGKPKLYVRMARTERIQHILLMVSFIILVVTGFMLKFPDAWWVSWIRQAYGEPLFELRGLLHRIAAVVMIFASFYHIYYVLFTERGKAFIRDIMFRLQDFKDMILVLKYNFGLESTRPRFDRFSYIEKVEYWALIWGTVIMTLTGIAMWFENQFMGWFSKLFLDVSETIHYFEAWLAFLAILVWHFYFVIFNPDVYPMNFSWLTGKMSEEEMEKEHPVELERIKEMESRAVEDEADSEKEES